VCLCEQEVRDGGGAEMVAVRENLVDLVWGDQRPPPPSGELIILDVKFAGVLLPPP